MNSSDRTRRCRLLLGTVAYRFMDCAREFVFGKPKAKKLTNVIHTLVDLAEHEPKSPEERKRWEQFRKEYCLMDTDDDDLHDLKASRNDIAHPTNLEDDPEAPDLDPHQAGRS